MWNPINPHLSLMADNILLTLEGLCTGAAGKKPLSTVNMLLMDLQVAAVSEGLQAGLTAIDDVCLHSVVRAGRESGNRLQQYQKTNDLSYHALMSHIAPASEANLPLTCS